MKNDTYDLLIRHFQSQTNPVEEQAIKRWLKNPENRKTYQQTKKIWKMSEETKAFTPDIDQEWERFQKHKDNPEALLYLNEDFSRQKKHGFIASPVMKMAAGLALLFLLFAAGWLYFSNQQTQFITETSGDAVKALELPDGSSITLYYNSSVKYPEKFKDNRHIHLRGEAYFEVTKALTPGDTFTVSTDRAHVSVLGTKFNLSDNSNTNTHLMVTEGKVRLSVVASGKDAIAQSGEQLVISETGSIKKGKQLNTNLLAWKTGQLIFENQQLIEIIPVIEKYLHKKITVTNGIGHLRFTGKFSNPTATELLDVLTTSTGIAYEVRANSIILFKNEDMAKH
ncbi:MAG: FecR family protein [Bacteroidota bacterium]